jgi:hypothetical protein
VSCGDNNSDLIVYPNPAKDKVFISGVIYGELPTRVSIYDNAGRIVLSELWTSDTLLQIDISSLSNGIYLLEIVTDSNRNILKIVIGEE